jgi:hypothetical protein
VSAGEGRRTDRALPSDVEVNEDMTRLVKRVLTGVACYRRDDATGRYAHAGLVSDAATARRWLSGEDVPMTTVHYPEEER